MTRVSDHIGVRGLGSTTVDVEIEVESPDDEEALEWKQHIYAAVRDAVKEKKEADEDT